MDKALTIVKKWGVTGCLALALVWFNFRLNILEERLYDCYEKRIDHVWQPSISHTPLYAILTEKQRIRKL